MLFRSAQKQQAIRDAFRDWIWRDPERRQALVRQYNEEMNATRPLSLIHIYSNFERTSPADSTYIQEYTVADDLSLIPGEVLYAGTYDECVKLHNALQDGSMTAEQVKAQAQAEKLYELDGRLYLHVQPCDGRCV